MALLDDFAYPLTFLAALGCALMGGLFFVFSNTIMRALGKLPPASGIAAMQSIDAVILNRLFFSVFFGTALLCVLLLVHALANWNGAVSPLLLAGSLLYLIGNIVVTMACNVPCNQELARVDAAAPESVELWRRYLVEWTRWNHVRTVTAIVAAAAFMIAMERM